MIVVVDASVAAMWFLPEPHSETAALLFADQYELVAPDLLILEVASALLKASRHHRRLNETADETISSLLPAAIRITPAADYAAAAFAIAERFGGSVYDGVYIALADALDAPVITNDSRLSKVAQKAGAGVRMIADGPPPAEIS